VTHNTALSLNVKKTLGSFSFQAAFESKIGCIALFGPSGSGKTTLINMIAGLIKPDHGRIDIRGACMFDETRAINQPPELRRIGYVFQDARLFPHLNVKRNLAYGMNLIADATRLIKFAHVVELLDLENLLDRRPHKLSGGERRRVAIGRALLTSPRLLLMDEPLANLDPKRRLEILPFIENLRDTLKIPIVYVSHSVEEVIRLADQVVVLDQGRVTACGGIRDVLNRIDIQTEFAATARDEAPDFGTVLTAVIAAHEHEDGLTRLAIADDTLYVPQIDEEIGKKLRIRVQARDVALAKDTPKGLSILNTLRAHVTEIVTHSRTHVDVKLQTVGGTQLWSRITLRSGRELEIKPGTKIWVLIKSVALESGLFKRIR